MVTKNRVVDLPEELMREILSRVSVKSLIRFKCVSKSWCNLINSKDFVELQLNKSKERYENEIGTFIILGATSLYSVDLNSPHHRSQIIELYVPKEIEALYPVTHYPPSPFEHFSCVELIGSSNGLVCFFYKSSEYCCFALYNPATRAFNKSPKLENKMSQKEYNSRSSDFVYDCVADDYKVFDFVRRGLSKLVEETRVYSLKESSWKAISNPPLRRVRSHRSVVANNFLHFIGYSDDSRSHVIIRLDVSTQRYDIMSLPFDFEDICGGLAWLRGKLHVITYTIKQPSYGLEIWVFEYGVEETWTRLFRTPLLSPYSLSGWSFPLAYSKDGKKLLVGILGLSNNLFFCDLESQTLSMFSIMGLPKICCIRIEPWVESLVSPCS